MRFFATTAMLVVLAGCATSTQEPVVDDVAADSVAVEDATSVEETTAGYRAPELGVELIYKSVFRGEPDVELRQIVVGRGEDYAIYANILDDGLSGPEDLFIEYSGVYWQDCIQAPISDYQREKLAALWPLETGKSTSMPFQGDLSEQMTIEIGEWSSFSSPDQGDVDTVQVLNTYEDQDISMFSPQLGYAVRIDWGDPEGDRHFGHNELIKVSSVDLVEFADYVALAQKACIQ